MFSLFLFSALESKLVSQFCVDENGKLIYNHITNGHWNGLGVNGHGENTNGYNGYGNNDYGNNGYGNSWNGYGYQDDIQNHKRTDSRGRGDTPTLPITADPPPIKVSAENTFCIAFFNCVLCCNCHH